MRANDVVRASEISHARADINEAGNNAVKLFTRRGQWPNGAHVARVADKAIVTRKRLFRTPVTQIQLVTQARMVVALAGVNVGCNHQINRDRGLGRLVLASDGKVYATDTSPAACTEYDLQQIDCKTINISLLANDDDIWPDHSCWHDHDEIRALIQERAQQVITHINDLMN